MAGTKASRCFLHSGVSKCQPPQRFLGASMWFSRFVAVFMWCMRFMRCCGCKRSNGFRLLCCFMGIRQFFSRNDGVMLLNHCYIPAVTSQKVRDYTTYFTVESCTENLRRLDGVESSQQHSYLYRLKYLC